MLGVRGLCCSALQKVPSKFAGWYVFALAPWLSLWESCRRRRLRGFRQSQFTLSVFASLSHLSQRERQGRPHAWLSLWESCRRRRLRGPWQSRFTLSVFASLRHLSQRERQEVMQRKEIFGAYPSNFAGKIQENRSGFLGRFKEVRREIEIPPGSFSFCHFFFWRSKRKSETAPASLQKIISPMPASHMHEIPD